MNNIQGLSGKKFHMLGIFFIFLAFCALVVNWFISRLPSHEMPDTPDVEQNSTHIAIPDIENLSDSSKSILERLKFQKIHGKYQQSYLLMIQKINDTDTTSIDIKEHKYFFSGYKNTKEKYEETLEKLEDHQKTYKIKCFARMRSLIMAVLYHDKKMDKKMTTFDPQLLKKIGALNEIPQCPSGGEYSIIYKDGRRFFHCSVHGTLRN
ncbi:MAG: hypothetical protein ACQETH_01680 [Candidatus Rifleibacteriota bacterium]